MPAMVHKLFKKRDFCDFVLHELRLLDAPGLAKVEMFRSPMTVLTYFSASGVGGLMESFRNATWFQAPTTMETGYATVVAKYRDEQDAKQQAAIDVLWGLWSGLFDEEISELAAKELQGATGFLWHRYCNDSNQELGVKYRIMMAAYSAGPIAAADGEAGVPGAVAVLGTSELGEVEKAELHQARQSLMSMRRKTVTFLALPVIGGASGADFTTAQMAKMWEESRFGAQVSMGEGRC